MPCPLTMLTKPNGSHRVSSILLLTILVTGWATATRADHAQVDSLNLLGRAYIFSHIEESVELYGQVAQEAADLGYRAGEARALQNQGVALYLNARLEESVEVALKAIRIFEELGMQHELAMTYGDLGFQMKRRNLDRAMEFMSQGIAIAEANKDSISLCSLYDNFGVLQEIADHLEGAARYYRLGLDYKTALGDSVGIPFSLRHMAGIAAMEDRMEQAAELLDRADVFSQANADTFGLIQGNVQRSEMAYIRGDLVAAAGLYNQSLSMPGILDHGRMVTYCFERLAEIYGQLQDYESAYENQIRFTAYRDSLFTVENNSRMAALELEYETEKKDRLIAENRLEMAARSRQIFVLVAVVVLLVLVGVGVVRYQHLKRRQLKQEMELRDRLASVEYEQRMTDEKLRISHELHDNIGSQLTFIISTIDNLSHSAAVGESRQGLDRLGDFGRDTLSELRHTVWAMKNEDEGFDALAGKLQDLKRRCREAGRELKFEVNREPGTEVDLSSGRLLNLLRIAQEAVQNAVKYSQDDVILMQLTADAQGLVLQIRDHGPGFDSEAVSHRGGTDHMRQRCEDSGGQFELVSGSGGTRVTCCFPSE